MTEQEVANSAQTAEIRKDKGGELFPAPPMAQFNTTTIRPMRWWSKLTRNYLYGYSRGNDWPLWVSWLLAPNKAARQRVRILMQIRKAGGDV